MILDAATRPRAVCLCSFYLPVYIMKVSISRTTIHVIASGPLYLDVIKGFCEQLVEELARP
jgi:hypothetical protein